MDFTRNRTIHHSVKKEQNNNTINKNFINFILFTVTRNTYNNKCAKYTHHSILIPSQRFEQKLIRFALPEIQCCTHNTLFTMCTFLFKLFENDCITFRFDANFPGRKNHFYFAYETNKQKSNEKKKPWISEEYGRKELVPTKRQRDHLYNMKNQRN